MGSFIPLPEDQDVNALRKQVTEASALRLAKAADLARNRVGADNSMLVMQRLDLLIDFIIPREPEREKGEEESVIDVECNIDRLRFDLAWENKMLETIEQLMSQYRKAMLTQGKGINLNHKPKGRG